MENAEIAQWLMENAGPVIRYRLSAEYHQDEGRGDDGLTELLTCPMVRSWIERIPSECDRHTLHGASPRSFENVMGKLFEFGLRRGCEPMDHRVAPFQRWMEGQIDLPYQGYLPVLHRTICAAFLTMLGYENGAVDAWVKHRLDTVYDFSRRPDLEHAYVPQDTLPGYPKAFRRSPLLNPDLYPDDDLKLPWIYDLYAFLHSKGIMGDEDRRSKVETVIKLVLSPEYQSLWPGYGVVRHDGQYYIMGWSVHLPGYQGEYVTGREFARMLLLLELLGRSRQATMHDWYRRSLKIMEDRLEVGHVRYFSRTDLPESNSGVWVLGMCMGLEEKRRSLKALECESLFRCLQIRSLSADFKK
jgi:hypothetical protein